MYVAAKRNTVEYIVQRIFDESHTKCGIDETKTMMDYRINEVYNKWIRLIGSM